MSRLPPLSREWDILAADLKEEEERGERAPHLQCPQLGHVKMPLGRSHPSRRIDTKIEHYLPHSKQQAASSRQQATGSKQPAASSKK
jgi:hypothetical protein